MNAPHKVVPTDAAAAAPARRSSFQVIMSELEQASPTTVMSRQNTSRLSFIKDYRRFNTTEERVKACLRTYTTHMSLNHFAFVAHCDCCGNADERANCS
jgi:hypothetical protein